MLKRGSILVTSGCILTFGVLVWLILSGPQEPRYQGRSLSSWVEEVASSSTMLTINHQVFVITTLSAEKDGRATKALISMGKDASRFLIMMLKSKDGPVRKRFLEMIRKQRYFKPGLLTADERKMRAQVVLYKLETNAAVTWKQILVDPDFDQELHLAATSWCQTLPEDAPLLIPLMLRLMADVPPNQRDSLWWGINRFGAEVALPVLVQQLQNRDRQIQLAAMQSIKLFGHQARSVMPVFEQQLKSSDEDVGLAAADILLSIDVHSVAALVYGMHHGHVTWRTTAYWLLARDEQATPTAISEISRGLTDPEPEIRRAAAKGLAKYGTNAQPALIGLTNLLSDQKLFVRVAASNAVSSIVGSR
jgi:hypothetical protein